MKDTQTWYVIHISNHGDNDFFVDGNETFDKKESAIEEANKRSHLNKYFKFDLKVVKITLVEEEIFRIEK